MLDHISTLLTRINATDSPQAVEDLLQVLMPLASPVQNVKKEEPSDVPMSGGGVPTEPLNIRQL